MTEYKRKKVSIVESKTLRYTYISLGILCIFLGIIGYIVPLMPGTVFLILSTFFFARSSEKMHNWMLEHKILGRFAKFYHEDAKMPLKAKIITVGLILVSISISLLIIYKPWNN
ncbi:MAG: YbaN family protein [Ignavibacteriaceae bacterium]|nr:YbaN family protein [Ignavibacteriaceae bacterium]